MSIWEQKWTVNDGPDDVFQGGNKVTKFRLEKRCVKGGFYYVVVFKHGEMCAEWDDCWLAVRGSAPFRLGVDPLDPFDPNDEESKKEYREVIEAALGRTTTSTRRLEGELDCGVGRKMAYMFVARRAAKVNTDSGTELRDLIIVRTASNFLWSNDDADDPFLAAAGDPIEDGTAHGNPK